MTIDCRGSCSLCTCQNEAAEGIIGAMTTPPLRWEELKAVQFADGALANHVAVLPLGATEQHGPHLPLSTDSTIAGALVAATMDVLAGEESLATPCVFLPVLAITNSCEHTNRPGTLSLDRALTLALILALARSIARTGIQKMVIINAHGGNVGVMVDASHAIRAELGMLCVASNWMRLGLPEGIISPAARTLDVHGGMLETSIMLAAAGDHVDMAKARDFESLQAQLARDFELLRAYGPIGFGWMGDDLHEAGAAGNASAASAHAGKAIMAHQAKKMAQLLAEVHRFQPAFLDRNT